MSLPLEVATAFRKPLISRRLFYTDFINNGTYLFGATLPMHLTMATLHAESIKLVAIYVYSHL